MNSRLRVILAPLIAAGVFLLLWENIVRIFQIEPYVLPAPHSVVEVLLGLKQPAVAEALLKAALQTAIAATTGFLIATLLGVTLGTLMSSFAFLRRGVYPLANLLQMVPVIALAPLLNIWFGYGISGVAASAAIVAIFPVIANTVDGLRAVEPKLLELFHIYGASPRQRWRALEFPAAMPQIFTGLKIAAGLAVIGAVVGELVSGVLDDPPIGAVIASALRNSDLNTVFAAIALSALIGFALFGAVSLAGNLVLGTWHSSARRTAVIERPEQKRSERRILTLGTILLAGMTAYAFLGEYPALKPSDVTGKTPQTTKNEPPVMKWETVSIQLNWVPEPEFGGIYAAQKFGYFADEKLKVKIIKGGPGIPSPQLTATGQVDFGIMGGDQIVTMRGQGAPLVAVYACFDRFPRGVVVHKDGAPDTLEALWRSKRTVAVEAGLPFVKWLNKQYGKSVNLVPSQGGLGQFKKNPLLAQAIFIFAEPVSLELDAVPTRIYSVADSGYNPYTVVVATREDFLKEKPEIVERMVRALRKGWLHYQRDPEPVNQDLTTLNPTMSLKAMNLSAKMSRSYVRGETKVLGRMTRSRWETLIDQLVSVEAVSVPPKPEACFQNF